MRFTRYLLLSTLFTLAATVQALATGMPMVPAGNAPVNFSGIWNKAPSVLSFDRAPPYRPEMKTRFDAQKPQDDPGSRCTESSMTRMMISPYPLEIVQWPDHLLLISEFNHVVRRIWLDRARHADDLFPTYHGDSIGHWEGETLVVDTIGFNARNYLDPSGNLMSPDMQVVERWNLVKGTKPQIRIDFTFTDPRVYTNPWTSSLVYNAEPDWKLLEFVCNDNNRNNPDQPGPYNFTSTDAPAEYVPANSQDIKR